MLDVMDRIVRLAGSLALATALACGLSFGMSAWRGVTAHEAVVATTSFTPEPFGDAGG